MELLLRELRHTAEQGAEFQDQELAGAEITIGSAQDQLIQLIGTDIKSQHAVLQGSGGKLRIKCERGCKVQVNGEPVSNSALSAGDVVQLAGHKLSVIQAPAGFDAALEFEPDRHVDASAFENAYRTNLSDTWLSKRLPAWLFAGLVVVLGFAIPAYFMGAEPEAPGRSLLPTDALWSSGALHPAHKLAVGDDCSVCHQQPFQRVKDETCTACHADLADHVMPGHEFLAANEIGRCASCHKEHNEPSYIVVDENALCTDCHAQAEDLGASNPHLQSIAGFSDDEHPPFEVALPTPTQTTRAIGALFEWNTVETKLADAVETSNLKFPHDVHLNVEKVRNSNDGNALGCGTCHTLSPDQEHFIPVTMEQHCQDCHELTFDASAPQRQLPHGEAVEAVIAMEGHFMRVYSDPNKEQQKIPRRRLPDRKQKTTECKGPPFECAAKRTRSEIANQFGVQGCVTCHEVEDLGIDDIYTRFQVHPVRLSGDFMPTARFNHRSHLTQRDVEGDEACVTCHKAPESSESAEVLIPDIDNCLACHADHGVENTVPVDCIACHSYHPLKKQSIQYLERTL